MTPVKQPTVENRFLTSVSWSGYLQILEAMQENPGVKVTYDQGCLELVTVSPEHEQRKTLLSQLLEYALLERGSDYHGGGCTTFHREALDKGLEPDECYWIANFSRFRPGYDPAVDCPPDLAIEVEVTRSCLNRMGIYKAIGVKEIWRYTADHQLVVEVLGPSGYEPQEVSPSLPELPLQELVGFIQVGIEKGNAAMLRAFREWLKNL